MLKKILYHYRPINLFIVCVTQLVVLTFLIQNSNSVNCFPIIVFPAIFACTVIITISGYLINDYFDYSIDEINKPLKQRLSKDSLLRLYLFNVTLGLVLAIFIANEIGNLFYTLIYFLATLLLFLYASHFKRLGLIGNVVVSSFSSLVIAIIWFVFKVFCIPIQNDLPNTILVQKVNKESILLLFMCFVFLSSMAREIIKDCQDISGDSKFGLQTLPIRIGINRTIFFVNFFLAILIIVSCTWIYSTLATMPIYKSVILVLIIFTIIYSMIKTNKAKNSEDFKFVSKILKTCMGFGILYLFTLSLPS